MPRSVVTSFVFLVALNGCRSADTSTFSVLALDLGDECASGGIAINTGVDADADGNLSAEEITETVVVCNGTDGTGGTNGTDGTDGADGGAGTDGVSVVFRTSTLDVGDAACSAGGTRLEYGLDNGDGGETAGDGVLGDGEVDGSHDTCNGEPAFVADTFEEPGGAAGTNSISGAGGQGQEGGNGGSVDVDTGQSNTAHLKVFTTGVADASFSLPTFAPDMSDAVVVSADLTVPMFAITSDATGLSQDDLFITATSSTLYQYDTGGSHAGVSALRVDAGVTVTFESTATSVGLNIDRVVIDGTASALRTDGGRAHLNLNGSYLHVGAAGAIDLSGIGGTGAAASLGLNFGVIVMEGTLDTTGGNQGYSGGEMGVTADYGLYATGQILGKGGSSASEGGGGGADVSLYLSNDGVLMNSASVDVSGGDGTTGGDGGSFDMTCNNECVLKNSGAIEGTGGNGTTNSGGDGSSVSLYAYYGPVTTSGDVRIDGGDSDSGSAGNGGSFSVVADGEDGGIGRIDISGQIDMAGGDTVSGESGGNGGSFSAEHDTSVYGQKPIVMYGYSDIVLPGGEGSSAEGGEGGSFYMNHDDGEDGFDTGGLANYADVDVSGGDAPQYAGGGGSAWVGCGEAGPSDSCFVFNRGAFDVAAGLGGGESGGGELGFEASAWVDHEGDVDLSGSDSSLGEPADGGSLQVEAYGTVSWIGNVAGSGGDSGDDGDDGGYGAGVEIDAMQATVTGDFVCTGGQGGANASGGGGGQVWLQSWGGGTTLDTTNSDVSAGTGLFDGEAGEFVVDGIDIASTF